METLAYLHLALAHETQTDTDATVSCSAWENPKIFISAASGLLSLTLAFSLIGMARQASAAIKEGDQGSEVTSLQQRLQQLGYFKENATGYFGSLTKKAVIQFQQAKGLMPDGVVGTSTEAALGEQPKSSLQPVREPSKRVWQLGDRGEQVSAIQESLAVAGFPVDTKGIFDQVTQDAVRRFQQVKGLTPDGIVGSQTMAALPPIGGVVPSPAVGRTRNQTDIKGLQKRLRVQGFYNGAIDGIWGAQTQAAVQAAQRSYNVSGDDLANGGF